MNDFGLVVEIAEPYDQAIDIVKAALKNEGFGVLTEIDVKTTLKNKLDVDFRPYAILGACNPPLAHKALSSVPEIGLLLPCNVTVEFIEEGRSIIRIINPKIMVALDDLANNEALVEVANDAHEKLTRVAEALKQWA